MSRSPHTRTQDPGPARPSHRLNVRVLTQPPPWSGPFSVGAAEGFNPRVLPSLLQWRAEISRASAAPVGTLAQRGVHPIIKVGALYPGIASRPRPGPSCVPRTFARNARETPATQNGCPLLSGDILRLGDLGVDVRIERVAKFVGCDDVASFIAHIGGRLGDPSRTCRIMGMVCSTRSCRAIYGFDECVFKGGADRSD